MSNLAKARSHIIFIVALLTAAAYILWAEQSRGVPFRAPGKGSGWSVEIGPFSTAAEAGRAWDDVRLAQGPVTLWRTRAGTMLRVEGLISDAEANQLCGQVRARGHRCLVNSPAS